MSAPVKAMMAGAMMLALTNDAQAQPPMPSHYAWSRGPNSINLHLRKHGQSTARTVTRSCVGTVDGVAKVTGRAIMLIGLPPAGVLEEDDICVLIITFNKAYTRAYVKEKTCRNWHGAQCTFDGSLMRQ